MTTTNCMACLNKKTTITKQALQEGVRFTFCEDHANRFRSLVRNDRELDNFEFEEVRPQSNMPVEQQFVIKKLEAVLSTPRKKTAEHELEFYYDTFRRLERDLRMLQNPDNFALCLFSVLKSRLMNWDLDR